MRTRLLRQRAHDLLGEACRDDDDAGRLDLGLERHPQRQLEVGGCELGRLLAGGGGDADAGRSLHRRARRRAPSGGSETFGEMVLRTGDAHRLSDEIVVPLLLSREV